MITKTNHRTWLLAIVATVVLLAASHAFAATLTVTSGPTFTPGTAFADNSIKLETLVNPPGINGDVVRMSGGATVTPPSTKKVTVNLAGNFSANTGDLGSLGYSFTVDLDPGIAGPVTYTVSATTTKSVGNP